LADLSRLTLDHGLAGTGRAAVPRVNVHVDYSTLTALTAAAAAAQRPQRPPGTGAEGLTQRPSAPPAVRPELITGNAIAGGPQFEDGTPLSRVTLLRITCDSEIKRFVFGPESEILDVGRSRRTFTRTQRAAIIARDKHCTYPGCHAPPAISECHHVAQWVRDHGETSVENGILVCWYHHDLIHRRDLTITRRGHQWVFSDAHGEEIDADGGRRETG
jgi:hypothetical protein